MPNKKVNTKFGNCYCVQNPVVTKNAINFLHIKIFRSSLTTNIHLTKTNFITSLGNFKRYN